MTMNLEPNQEFSADNMATLRYFLFFEQIGLLPQGILAMQEFRESK